MVYGVPSAPDGLSRVSGTSFYTPWSLFLRSQNRLWEFQRSLKLFYAFHEKLCPTAPGRTSKCSGWSIVTRSPVGPEAPDRFTGGQTHTPQLQNTPQEDRTPYQRQRRLPASLMEMHIAILFDTKSASFQPPLAPKPPPPTPKHSRVTTALHVLRCSSKSCTQQSSSCEGH